MPSFFPQLLDFQFFAPTILRLILGVILIVHGYQKLFQSFGQTAAFFGQIGIKPAKFWVLAVGVLEFFGGILLIAGLFTQLIAILFAIVMIVAIWKVKFKMGFVNGWEFDIMLFGVSIALALLGAGAFAIDLPL